MYERRRMMMEPTSPEPITIYTKGASGIDYTTVSLNNGAPTDDELYFGSNFVKFSGGIFVLSSELFKKYKKITVTGYLVMHFFGTTPYLAWGYNKNPGSSDAQGNINFTKTEEPHTLDFSAADKTKDIYIYIYSASSSSLGVTNIYLE